MCSLGLAIIQNAQSIHNYCFYDFSDKTVMESVVDFIQDVVRIIFTVTVTKYNMIQIPEFDNRWGSNL